MLQNQQPFRIVQFLCLLLFGHIQIFCQDNGSLSPTVIAFDRFGNHYTESDITVPEVSGTAMSSCVAGWFTLTFPESGSGLNDGTAETDQMRAILCQVFEDISNMITPADDPYTLLQPDPGFIRIEIMSQSLGSTTVANGIQLYSVSSTESERYAYSVPLPLRNGIIDGELWKSFNTGFDSWEAQRHTRQRAAQSNFYHARIRVNLTDFPASSWHLSETAPPIGMLDFYTVMFHEAMHTLGVSSFVQSDGSSELHEYYSRWDTRLTSTGQNIVLNSGDCEIMSFSGSTINSDCVVSFIGPNSPGTTIHSPNSFTNSSFEHFSADCGGQPYLMNSGPTPNQSRIPLQEEVNALCDIGYSLTGSVGTNADWIGTVASYSSCGSRLAGTDDIFVYGTNTLYEYQQGQGGTILLADFLDNDEDQSHPDNRPTTYAPCPEIIKGGGQITNEMTSSFEYQPATDFIGIAVIRYQPLNTITEELGNYTYIFINVTAPDICQTLTCNIVNGGDFELVNTSYAFEHSNWTRNTNHNTPQHYYHNGTEWLYGNTVENSTSHPGSGIGCYLNSPIVDSHNGSALNNHYVGFGGSNSSTEALALDLCSPLVPGEEYVLDFWARRHLESCSGTLSFYTSEYKPCFQHMGPTQLDGTLNSSCFDNPDYSVQGSLPTQVEVLTGWNQYQIPFIYNGTVDGNFLLIRRGTEGLSGGTSNLVYIDDIRITPVLELTSIVTGSCPGSADGSIDITVSGGSGNYSYLWSNMATTEDLTGLNPGLYTVEVTDIDLGCSLIVEGIEVEELPDCCPTLQMTVTPESTVPNGIDINAYVGSNKLYTFTIENTGGSTVPGGEYTFWSDIIAEGDFVTNYWVDLDGTLPDPVWSPTSFADQASLDDFLSGQNIAPGQIIHIGISFTPLQAGEQYHHSYSLTYGDGDCNETIAGTEELFTNVYYGCPWGWSGVQTECSTTGDITTCFKLHSAIVPDLSQGLTDIAFTFRYDPGFLSFDDSDPDNHTMPLSLSDNCTITFSSPSSVPVPAPSGQMYMEFDVDIAWDAGFPVAYVGSSGFGDPDLYTFLTSNFLCLRFGKVPVLPDQYPSNSTVIECVSHLVTLEDNSTQSLGTDGAIVYFTDDAEAGCLEELITPEAGFFQNPEVCFETPIHFTASEPNGWHIWECVGIDPDNSEESYILWGPNSATIPYVLEGNYEVTHYVTIDGVTGVDVSTFYVDIPSDPGILDVSGIETIDSDSEFTDGILVTSTGQLTISNSTLLFADGAGIIVEPGGVLNIYNSTLEKLGCASMWRGIDAQGNSSANQSPTNQGLVNIQGSIIRHARLAVANYDRLTNPYTTDKSGGIIYCHNTEFFDCPGFVKMARYYPGQGFVGDQTQFTDCLFKYTSDYDITPTWYDQPVELIGVRNPHFINCSWINESPGLLGEFGWGYKAAVYVHGKCSVQILGTCSNNTEPCPPLELNDNVISGFRYGLVVESGRAKINKMKLNNFHNVYVRGSKGTVITENKIGVISLNVPVYNAWDWPAHYGIYLDRSSAYTVEENTVDYNTGLPYKSAGIIARGSGPAQNMLYRNTIKGMGIGTLCYDDNRGEADTEGLKLHCNDYSFNGSDIVVVATEPAPNSGWGISQYQGQPFNGFDEFSAGNDFDLLTNGDGINAKEIRNYLDWVNYYYHTSEGQIDVGGVNEPTVIPLNTANQCDVQLFKSQGERDTYSDLQKAANENARMLLGSLIDGGDSQALLTEVILTQYGEALELYYELSAKSPYLSEEVMIESIQKEAELPPLLLALILESNPHAAKSAEIQEKLDQRSIPLDDYMRAMIDQGLYVISSKEELEARISRYESEYHVSLNRNVADLFNDDTVIDKVSAIESSMTGKETLDLRYLRIDLYAEQGDLTIANALLNSLPSDFGLDARKDQEYLDYVVCFGVLTSVENEARNTLTPNEISSLETIAYKHSTRASAMAMDLLQDYDQREFVEVLIDPEFAPKSNKRRRSIKEKPKDNNLSVYPNPSNDWIVLNSTLLLKAERIELVDKSGSRVHSQAILNEQRAVLIDVSRLAPASYELILLDGQGATIATTSIVVSR